MYPQQPYQPPKPHSGTYQQPTAAPPPMPDGISSIDYLNQIAPEKKGGLGFSSKQIWLLGGGLLLALGAMLAVVLSNTGSPDTTTLAQQLSLRSTALEKVVKESQPNIQGRDLSTLNSSLSIQLTSASSSLAQATTEAGIKPGKPSKALIAQEDKTELLATLNDARLSGIFDRVYVRELTYELQMFLVLLSDTHDTTKNEGFKQQLSATYDSISALHTRLTELTSTSA